MCRYFARLLSQGCDAGSMLPVQYKTVSPVGNRVFVKVDNEEATSSGGILLPTSAQKKPTQGEVVSLGDAQSLKVRRIPGLDTARLPQRDCYICDIVGLQTYDICPAGVGNMRGCITHAYRRRRRINRVWSTCADGDSISALALQAGDKVVYSKYAGTEVALDKTDYVLLKVSKLLGCR